MIEYLERDRSYAAVGLGIAAACGAIIGFIAGVWLF
jgi:hypothetical protein